MKSKKASHVGFVMSFTMFITFLIFMYIILNSRVDFGQQKSNSVEYLKAELIERLSGNLTSVSIVITENDPDSCVELDDFFDETDISNRFIVQTDSGAVLDAGTGGSGNDLRIQRNGNTFFIIYASEEFSAETSLSGSCEEMDEGQEYEIGLIRSNKEIFESSISRFFSNYTSNYTNLKNDMNLAEIDDFGFRFVYNNGTEILALEENLTVNVYAERNPVQYIKRNGVRESGFIDAIIW